MSSEVAVSVRNLSKCHQVYDTPRDRFKQFLLSPLRRRVGLPPRQYFHEFLALQDVSFDVERGTTVGIIGRNGSGKSTLLQMICGTLSPTSGTVETCGRIAALLELGSGFNPDFTGRENVFLNALLLGLTRAQVEERFDAIAAFADIGGFIDQPVKTYSSGMVVRLAFAVIAHVDADILIIDEALAVGDAFFTQKCMRFLRGFMRSGTVLFVSHDTSAIINLCNHAILLEDGRIRSLGAPKAVISQYIESLYASDQAIDGVPEGSEAASDPVPGSIDYHDVREELLNASTLRNDIEIFNFNANCESFGTGRARIRSIRLLDPNGASLAWVVGGQDVILEVECHAEQEVLKPIIGFQFKDRLGQIVFGENTFLVYQNAPLRVDSGSTLFARFEFRLPLLPSGDYSFTAAIADGTQHDHVQHHFLHDGLIIRVHASSVCLGLIGVPMKSIKLMTEKNFDV